MRLLPRAALTALLTSMVAVSAADARTVSLGEFRLTQQAAERIHERWVDRLLATHERGTWAPARVELTDADLRDMGLPPRRKLLGKRFPVPTEVKPDGRMVPLGTPRGKGGGKGGGSSRSAPAVTTFAGTGFFGIRPGAWLLLVGDGGISWCSMAHVFGSPGSFQVSTAGHCGKVGDVGTVIGVAGNRNPVLLDFGKFVKSTGDGGIGRDWALLSVEGAYQHLVTPTMAFWGGPKGVYTKTGQVVSGDLSPLFRGKQPTFSVNPDPLLAQQVVHYGHGIGVGAGGTPRTGTAIAWQADHFSFFGALSPGDSGSGTNTVTGDAVGAQREAAGINTHIYVDPSLRTGLGLMAGTRITKVGTPANGQLVPYPAPAPGLP